MILRHPLALLALVLLLPLAARADEPMIYASNGQAIQGYDTVAYFTDGKAVKGDLRYSVMWKGAIWLFASAQNRELFEANPRGYAPRYGGYCAYGMARGRVVGSTPETWSIRDGRLYLVNGSAIAARWQKDAEAEIALANANWPAALAR